MKNCIYEPVFGLFLLFNFQIDSALTFSSRLSYVILLQHRVSLLILSLTLHHEKENSGIMDNMLSDGIIVGVTGNTGRSTGYHLHLTCKKDGKSFNPTSLLNLIEKSFALSALSMSK